MSERKSWDIQRKPKAAPSAPPPAPMPPVRTPAQQGMSPVRSRRPQSAAPAATATRPSPRRAPLPSGTLRERRKRRRRIVRYVLLVILIALIIGVFYLLWRPGFRIQSVSAQGPGAEAAKAIALADIRGTYFHVVPRNSIFFYPQQTIRAAILDAVPQASAVSLRRDSFHSLSVMTVPREGSFIWCGTSIDTPDPNGCYEADVQGFIFEPAAADSNAAASSTASTTSSKGVHEPVRVFAPLDKDVASGESPVRAHVASAQYLPNALKFVAAARTLGAPVSALAIRGDEADLWLNGPTRITYVLGQEEEAANVAASALPSLDLTGGTIQYIDLRFPGKAYVKKYGE